MVGDALMISIAKSSCEHCPSEIIPNLMRCGKPIDDTCTKDADCCTLRCEKPLSHSTGFCMKKKVPACRNSFGDRRCEFYVRNGACTDPVLADMFRKMCNKACGYCKSSF